MYYASILNAISIVIFIISIWFIQERIKLESLILNNYKCRASDYTIECYTIPQLDNSSTIIAINTIKNHFETILSNIPSILINNNEELIKIMDINIGTSCYQYIQLACMRGKQARNVDQILGKITTQLIRKTFNIYELTTDNMRILNALKRALYEYEVLSDRCAVVQFSASKLVDRVYVTFETEEGYLR